MEQAVSPTDDADDAETKLADREDDAKQGNQTAAGTEISTEVPSLSAERR